VATGVTNLSKQVVNADKQKLLQDFDITLGQFSPWNIASGATSIAVSFGAVSAFLIVLFSGIYFAVDPHTYVRLAARIAPEGRRNDVPLMLYQTGDVLRRWLIGQGIAIAVIGGITYVGLLILGVPIAFVLALFAGLTGFLPYLGPIIGAVPMVLVAGGDSLHLSIWVVCLCARSVRRELPAHAADPGARRIPAARRGDPQSARARRPVRHFGLGACYEEAETL
jgi:predicted PurR-regulated permease PerM